MVLVVNELTDDSEHESPDHPERPGRVEAAMAAVQELHLGSDLIVAPAYSATRSELTRVHDAGYLDELGAFCYGGGGDIDQDTYATFDSWSIATRAAGAGLSVVRELQRRGEGVGFVASRPPGHHALRDRAMGFCLLNNVAVSAAALVSQGERVAIIDWDVHHGNGTQQIFWDEPHVLYVSMHQWPLFPGSGAAGEVGGRLALGSVVNVPLPAGATGDVMRRALDDVVAPVVDAFDPTWVLVSAGFDAHHLDPMADLCLSDGDFAQMSLAVSHYATAPGRLAFFLEGGYDLGALQASVRATLSSALGAPHDGEPPTNGGPGGAQLATITAQRDAALASWTQIFDEEDSR
ncbi:MAG: histone deacetylase [Actinomycetota bacterium]|nr:histone deacetylase [Actinomycetota bacterium]